MSYTIWLRWGIYAGIFLIPFIPFVVALGGVIPNMFFPYITGKNFVFRIIVELVLLFYIVLALKEPKYRPSASPLMWATLAFVAWMAIATMFAIDPIKSFWSNFERMEGYVGLLHLFVWFVVAGAVLTADKLWERFFNTSILASAVMGVYALLQVTHLFGFTPTSQSGPRADTSLGNATYLAVYLLVMFFVTLLMLVRRRQSGLWQALYGVAIVLQLMGLYFTETRGAILGVVGGVLVAALYIAWQGKGAEWRGLRRVSIGALAAVVVMVGAFFALKDTSLLRSSSTLNRLASISLTDRTTAARFEIWNMAWEGFKEKPLAGWGQENFNYVFNKYYSPAMWDQEQWFDRAHNQFIDWFIAGGLPAGILYLALYLLAAWAVLRAPALSVPERAILGGLLAGFAFNNLFVFDNLVSAVYFFALLAFVHSLTRRELPSRLVLTRPMGEHGIAVAAPVVGAVVLVGGWALNVPSMVRAQTLVQAIQVQTAQGARNPQENIALFKSALAGSVWPQTPLGFQETVEQLAQYSSTINASSANPDTKQQIYTLTNDSLRALTAQRSGDARLELFYGTFLASAGQWGGALEHLQEALKNSPQKQQILIQLAITSLQAGSATEALQYFKVAFDLEPTYDLARVMYAAGYYYVGQQAAGDAILTEGFGSPVVDNEQLLRVYTDTKQYARVEAIWQLRIDKDPKNADLYLGLAQAYFTAGDNAKTIVTLEKIAQLQPGKAAEIQQLIAQIRNGSLKP